MKKLIRKRMAMVRIKHALHLAKKMDHTLIAYAVFEPTITKLKEQVLSALKELKVKTLPTDAPSHISVAQIPGSYEEEVLEKLLLDGKLNASFQGSELTFLEGTEANFIALKLQTPKQYQLFQQELDQELETRKWPGGFKAHISLVKGEKTVLTKDVFEKIKDKIDPKVEIVPTKILLFNKDHKVEHAIRI